MGRAYRPALDAVERGETYNIASLSDEVFAISNRGYTPGFLVGNPGEKAIYFEKNKELHEEEMAGIVAESDPAEVPENIRLLLESRKIARIQVKNRIDIGDILRMISPTQSIEFTLEKIYSLS